MSFVKTLIAVVLLDIEYASIPMLAFICREGNSRIQPGGVVISFFAYDASIP